MSEETPVENELPVEWQKAMRGGLVASFENFELFGRVDLDPITLSDGIDIRVYRELSEQEQEWVRNQLWNQLHGGEDKLAEIALYEFKAP